MSSLISTNKEYTIGGEDFAAEEFADGDDVNVTFHSEVSLDSEDSQAEKLINETDIFREHVEGGNLPDANGADELNEMLEKAEQLAAMMRSFSTGGANVGMSGSVHSQTGLFVSSPSASNAYASHKSEMVSSGVVIANGKQAQNQSYRTTSESSQPGPLTPMKKKTASAACTPSSVNVKSIQSDLSSVGSGSIPPFEISQIDDNNDDDDENARSPGGRETTLPKLIEHEVEGVYETIPVALRSKFDGVDDSDNRFTLPPVPSNAITSAADKEESETDAPGLILSPAREEGDETDREMSPPAAEKQSTAYSKVPAADQPKFVEWEEVKTATEGDDDYVPLVDYSKQGGVRTGTSTINSSRVGFGTKTRVFRKARASRFPTATLLVIMVVVALLYYLFGTQTEIPIEVEIEDVPEEVVEPTPEYIHIVEQNYDTDFVTNWPSSTGLCFDANDIFQKFDYNIIIERHEAKLKAALAEEEMKKMEDCKKPLAGMRFPWCRKENKSN